MKKSQAYKILNLPPAADARTTEQAYWQLAHKYREEEQSHERGKIIELNEAYAALMSHEREEPLELIEPRREDDPWAAGWEAFVLWSRHLIQSTAARWPGRGAEIAALTACVLALAGLALWSGADPLWTILVLAAALVLVRAPWRRTR